jgi:hypothetical protein
MYEDCQEVSRSALVKGIESKRAILIWHAALVVELCYLWLCMYLWMHLLLIVTLIIALPLDQVLQAVVPHSAVQYSLNLILFLTIDKSWGWGWCRSARDGIRMCNGQLDHREDGVKAAEVGRQSEAICAMADTGFDDKRA